MKRGYVSSFIFDKLIFGKISNEFGGRLMAIASGSAPISDETLDFMKICLSVPIMEAYAQTETLMSCAMNSCDLRSGHVGGVAAPQELKLIDVPEMDYTTDFKDKNGNLCPKGEICIRGCGVMSGYYKNPKLTFEILDEDGWLHSGDIGMILPDNNGLQIIDRRKNIFKLSQGEYIAPERLESAYKSAYGLADIFVYGNSLKSHLVAIVNIDTDILKKF